MKSFRILPNGFIKTYINGELNSTLFHTSAQVNGLISDGFVQVGEV